MDARQLVVHLESPYAKYDSAIASPQEVFLAGLNWPMEYWAGLAVGWLEQGAPIDAYVAAALDEVAKKPFSQAVRHRAFALVRRWERGQQNAT